MPISVPLDSRTPIMFPRPLRGRIERPTIPSQVLEGNPWGDPVERELQVYIPPSGRTEGRPLLVLLSGYTGSGFLHFQRPRYLSDTRVSQLDRLIRTGLAGEAVMVSPDCMTTLGGSQYVNSSATGRYEDYVTEEIVPWVRERYRTGAVGVLGTSSGGYGALSLALRHPDVFSAAASDSGDMYFEYGYLPDFPRAFRAIRKAGGPEALLRRVFARPVDGWGPLHPMASGLELMAYASCYSPVDDEPGRFELPFDLTSGALRSEIWAKWLARDPVRMIARARFARALRRLRYVYVDGGEEDEWNLEVSARIFAAVAQAQGAHVDHREYSGRHSDVAPRYEVIFPAILHALGAPGRRDKPAAKTGPRRGRSTHQRPRPRATRAR